MRKLLAAFLTLALCAACVPVRYARADVSDWPAWVSESLQTTTIDLATALWGDKWGDDPATLGGWATQYISSYTMAEAVRSLDSYKSLYGSNPLDRSTVIRSYDGGEQVSVLTAEGYLDAYLWLHDGVPPYDDTSSTPEGPISGLPAGVGIIYAEYLQNVSYTFADGHSSRPYMSSFVDSYNDASSSGASVAIYQTDSGGYLNSMMFVSGSNSSLSSPSGDVGFSFFSPDLASKFGSTSPYNGSGYCGLSSVNSDFRSISYTHSSWFGISQLIESSFENANISGPVGFYRSMSNVGSVPVVYVITNSKVFLYGNWYGGQIGPTVPPSSEPVGPSSPDVPSPEPVEQPQSDTPIQNTTVNVTVTLPDGTTTIVQAPTSDISPIVHWLSIINANIVAWSKSLYDMVDGWLANISQWLQEIFSELEAFKLSVDNWAVSILSALDTLGGGWPMDGEDNTNFWNNVAIVNNNVWGSAPLASDVQVVSGDLNRLKALFPFSIPWDVFAILLLFNADPVAPAFDVPLVYSDGAVKTEQLHVDLSPFDGAMATWRRLAFVAFCFWLALKSKDLLGYVVDAFDLF